MAGEVSGLITQVKVCDNQHVKAGDVLFTIDPSTFTATVQQADAQIATAQARVTALNADVAAKAADLAAAGDDLALAQANFAREKALMDKGFNTRARMDAAEHAVAVARDKIVSIRAEVEQARAELANGAQVPGVNPAIAAAQANRAKATLDIERTVVRAPADGIVTQVSRLQVGQMVFPGVPMLSIVRDGSARVEANFKETDLGRMRPGQPAEIEIDAYPGLKRPCRVHRGGHGVGVLGAAGAERYGQLGQGDPARTGAHRHRQQVRAAADRGAEFRRHGSCRQVARKIRRSSRATDR